MQWNELFVKEETLHGGCLCFVCNLKCYISSVVIHTSPEWLESTYVTLIIVIASRNVLRDVNVKLMIFIDYSYCITVHRHRGFETSAHKSMLYCSWQAECVHSQATVNTALSGSGMQLSQSGLITYSYGAQRWREHAERFHFLISLVSQIIDEEQAIWHAGVKRNCVQDAGIYWLGHSWRDGNQPDG
jgi:hypothetical protein